MRVELTPPPWATHLLSDLTDWQRAPLPVCRGGAVRPAGRRLLRVRLARRRRRAACRSRQPEPAPEPLVALRLPPDRARLPAGSRCRGRRAGAAAARHACCGCASPRGCWARPGTPLVYTPAGQRRQRAAAGAVPGRQGVLRLGAGAAGLRPSAGTRARSRPAHLVFVPPARAHAGVRLQPGVSGASCCDEVLPAVEAAGRAATAAASPGAPAWAGCSAPSWPGSGRRPLRARWSPSRGPSCSRRTWSAAIPSGRGVVARRWCCGEAPRPLALVSGLRHPGVAASPSNRRLAAVLAGRGADVGLVTRNAGHNWMNWRNGIAGGLALRPGLGAPRPAEPQCETLDSDPA